MYLIQSSFGAVSMLVEFGKSLAGLKMRVFMWWNVRPRRGCMMQLGSFATDGADPILSRSVRLLGSLRGAT